MKNDSHYCYFYSSFGYRVSLCAFLQVYGQRFWRPLVCWQWSPTVWSLESLLTSFHALSIITATDLVPMEQHIHSQWHLSCYNPHHYEIWNKYETNTFQDYSVLYPKIWLLCICCSCMQGYINNSLSTASMTHPAVQKDFLLSQMITDNNVTVTQCKWEKQQ